MALKTLLLFLVVAILPAISPGPAILLAVSNTLRYGPRATVFSALGNALGLVCLGFAVSFGLAAVMAASATAFMLLKVGCGVYLVYLGIRLWRDRRAFAPNTQQQQEMPMPWRLFLQGWLVSVTNPKAIVVIAALLPPFIDMRAAMLPQVAVLSISYALLCLGFHWLLALAGGRMRKFLLADERIIYLRRSLATLFIGFGTALATMSR